MLECAVTAAAGAEAEAEEVEPELEEEVFVSTALILLLLLPLRLPREKSSPPALRFISLLRESRLRWGRRWSWESPTASEDVAAVCEGREPRAALEASVEVIASQNRDKVDVECLNGANVWHTPSR